MKICTICNQTYRDDEQNYCLNDGSVLNKLNDDAPPTVFVEPPRITNEMNWQSSAPVSPWQNQPMQQNQPLANSAFVQGKNQTLATVSLVLGILSVVLFCCYGGLPLGIGAMITGYLGYNNANTNPMQFGGRGLALAGMIMGVMSLAGSLIGLMFLILGSLKN